MFGNLSAFVNGNTFFGVSGDDLFLRLSGEDQVEILKKKGASMLEPMKGRPMKDYIVMPKDLDGPAGHCSLLDFKITRMVQQITAEEDEKIAPLPGRFTCQGGIS